MAPRSKNDYMWEDKEILFDLPYSYLRLRPGEKILERFDSVEDMKGNKGVKGRLVLTNLRVIWHAVSSPRINLCLGRVVCVSSRAVSCGLALYLLGAFRSNRYEFVFTELRPGSGRHAAAAVALHKAYNGSKMYRELKLRGAIIHNKQLNMLPGETISVSEHSVWNLSNDAGSLGVLIATNVRIVWYALANEAFNVSLPYIAVESVCVRPSKFGEALVVVSTAHSGGYVLGFRVDPPARLERLRAELGALHEAYCASPLLGVHYQLHLHGAERGVREELEELEEVGEARGEMGPALYLAARSAPVDQQPVYSAYLGLAVQPPPPPFTLKSLFEVQTS